MSKKKEEETRHAAFEILKKFKPTKELWEKVKKSYSNYIDFIDKGATYLEFISETDNDSDNDLDEDPNIDQTEKSYQIYILKLYEKALLGFRVLFYIDLEKYVDKAFRELPIDQTQLKAFLNSEFDNRIQITSLIPWLQLSPLFGISIPWHKDDMPSVTNLKNTAGEQCTLGSIIYQLSRDQNKKNDTLPLSDTTYAFFIEYLLCMVHKNKNVIPQIIDLLKFSSDQFYIDSKDGILNEPKPQEIPNSNGISEAWKLAHQYSSFSYSFLRRFCNALSDSDDQFHDQTSELLTVLNEDAKTRDEETELCKAIIIHMLKQDTMSHDNTLIPFIQSIYDTFLRDAKDSDRPAWAQLFYDLSLEQLNGSNIVLGFSRDIVKLLKFPVPEDEAAQYDPTKVDLDASATQLENYLSLNDERMIIVTHNMLKELGLDFMYQIFPASENNGLYISIVPDSLNKLVHVQIVIGIDDLTIFRYTIDTSTVPYIIHATVLDPEIIRVHTDVTNVLVYIAHKSIETFNIWNNQKETERKEELEKKNIAKQNHNPKPLIKTTITNTLSGNGNKAQHVDDEDQPQHNGNRYHKSKKRKKHDPQELENENENLTAQTDSRMLEIVHAHRFAQLIDIESIVWSKQFDPHEINRILEGIKRFNEAYLSGSLTNNFKVFSAIAKSPSKGKIMQITIWPYRVLCELGKNGTNTAKVFSITHKHRVHLEYTRGK